MRVLLLGGHPSLVRKAVECGLEVVNIRKSVARDPSTVDAEVHVLDYQNVPAVTALAERLHRDRPFDRVLTQTEAAQLVAGHLTTHLGLAGNGAAVTRTLHDKRRLRALLNECGLGPVAVGAGRSRDDLAEFVARHGPAVAKPPMGSGSVGVRKVPSRAEVDAAWAWLSTMEVGDFMLEELLVGPEVSVETVSMGGRHVVVAITGKDTGDGVVELGHVVPAAIADQDAARAADLTVRMLDAVQLVEGAAHTEVILTADGPRVVEAHSRRGGDHIVELVELVYGVDLERMAFQTLVTPILTAPIAAPNGAAAIRFLTAEAGQVMAIEGVDEAATAPLVKEAKVFARVGDVLGPLLWSDDRCGHVLTHAPDAASASAAAQAAAARITIRTAPTVRADRITMGTLLARAGEVLDPFATADGR